MRWACRAVELAGPEQSMQGMQATCEQGKPRRAFYKGFNLPGCPQVVKPVYGFLSDTVPLFGYRRRSYLVICGLLGELNAVARCLPPA